MKLSFPLYVLPISYSLSSLLLFQLVRNVISVNINTSNGIKTESVLGTPTAK